MQYVENVFFFIFWLLNYILENLIQHQSDYLIAIWMFFPRSEICKIQIKVALMIPGYDLNPL